MKLLTRLLLLTLLYCFLAGCGGSSLQSTGNRQTGRAVFTVKWPAVSRVIPVASNSILISILQGTKVWTSQLIAKPATTATFSNLPLGNVTVTATAYPNVDGTGVAQATATMTVNIQAGLTTPVTLTMGSTIVALIPSVANLDFSIGQGATVTVTAQDKDGNVVLFGDTIQWSTAAAGVATVDATGRVTAVGAGTTTITAKEPESGQTATINVNVEPFKGVQRIYVSDYGHNQIVRTDSIFGANKITFGAFGADPDQFNGPAGIAVGDDNRIYIVDQNNNRIVRIDDMNGTNWISYPTLSSAGGSGTGQFNHPTGISVDHNNIIYVADTGNNRIVRMDDMTGTNWTTLGGPGVGSGTSAGQFNTPTSVCISSDNRIYVADKGNNQIERMDDMTGTNWTVYNNGLSSPVGVFVAADNRIYIADQNNLRIHRINDMTGTLATDFVKSVPVNPLKDPPHDTFGGPTGIYVTPESVLYVTDFVFPEPSGGRVAQLFSPFDDTNFWPSLLGLSGPMSVYVHTSP